MVVCSWRGHNITVRRHGANKEKYIASDSGRTDYFDSPHVTYSDYLAGISDVCVLSALSGCLISPGRFGANSECHICNQAGWGPTSAFFRSILSNNSYKNEKPESIYVFEP